MIHCTVYTCHRCQEKCHGCSYDSFPDQPHYCPPCLRKLLDAGRKPLEEYLDQSRPSLTTAADLVYLALKKGHDDHWLVPNPPVIQPEQALISIFIDGSSFEIKISPRKY